MSAADLYLDLLKRTLTGMAYEDPPLPGGTYDAEARSAGRDVPQRAPCMIGTERLDNVRECVQQVLADNIPGDLAECGTWRSGTCIWMRALLAVAGVTDRDVWVIDSFAGLPSGKPDEAFMAVPLEEARHNFDLYGLLDGQVRFLPGWFCDTLPGPVGQLAVLRFDGDLYESARGVLATLYPKLSEGGYLIVDDSHFPEVGQAVQEYRAGHGITAPYLEAGPYCSYWRKEA